MSGNDTATDSADTESTPADAFALVGHDIRVEAIKILGENPAERELSLSEVRSRLTTDVEPSQLHYHLKKLVGHFVDKTDGGYSLRPAGAYLCLVLHAGTFERRQEQLSVDTDVDCYRCQSPVEAHFDDGWYVIECSDCSFPYGIGFLGVPLEAFDDAAAAFSHLRRHVATQTVFLSYGVCPCCSHPISPNLQVNSEDRKLRKVGIGQPCDLCGAVWTLPVGRALLTDPGLVGFCADHGVDILSTPFWELEFAVTDKHLTVHSTDPWEIALAVTFDGDTLELIVDGDLNVVERNRVYASNDGRTSTPRGIQSEGSTVSREAGERAFLHDRDDCLEYLRHHRWSDGVVCPQCDSAETIKMGTTSRDAQRYRCHACDSTFNDLTGTIFAGHHLTLPELFHIIEEIDETNTVQIARQLERSYSSVLGFVHEVRDADDEDLPFELSGGSEGDETGLPASEGERND